MYYLLRDFGDKTKDGYGSVHTGIGPTILFVEWNDPSSFEDIRYVLRSSGTF